jgi:hypothetical protein
MSRPKGATLDEMIEATDWLSHTARAALTGLAQARILIVRRSRPEPHACCQITEAAGQNAGCNRS